MVHEINGAESRKNRDFVNFHTVNRKRRFDEMNSETVFSGGNVCPNPNNNNNSQNFCKRTVSFLQSSQVSDEEMEKILNEASLFKSREEIKEYLKKTLNNLISSLIYIFII